MKDIAHFCEGDRFERMRQHVNHLKFAIVDAFCSSLSVALTASWEDLVASFNSTEISQLYALFDAAPSLSDELQDAARNRVQSPAATRFKRNFRQWLGTYLDLIEETKAAVADMGFSCPMHPLFNDAETCIDHDKWMQMKVAYGSYAVVQSSFRKMKVGEDRGALVQQARDCISELGENDENFKLPNKIGLLLTAGSTESP